MSLNYTQSQENDIDLMDFEKNILVTEKQAIKPIGSFNAFDQAGWYARYVPPYRAAHFASKSAK